MSGGANDPSCPDANHGDTLPARLAIPSPNTICDGCQVSIIETMQSKFKTDGTYDLLIGLNTRQSEGDPTNTPCAPYPGDPKTMITMVRTYCQTLAHYHCAYATPHNISGTPLRIQLQCLPWDAEIFLTPTVRDWSWKPTVRDSTRVRLQK
jgi:hypothetical protein